MQDQCDNPAVKQVLARGSAPASVPGRMQRLAAQRQGTSRSDFSPQGEAQKPVLVIVHQHHSNPGRIGHWLRARGHRLDIRRPRFGCNLPETLEEYAGAVIFGGPMSANDEEDYIRLEIDWIEVALRENKPFLGVCLGAQLLARKLGSVVTPHPDGYAEIGYYPVTPTAAGEAICTWPDKFYQWHREGFDLPSGAELLAQGREFPNQAFCYGSAVAVQFHSEITYALVNRWSTSGRHRLTLNGAQPRDEHLTGHLRYAAGVGTWMDGFLGAWLEGRINGAAAAQARTNRDKEIAAAAE